MAQTIADRRDLDFVLYEQMDVEGLLDREAYADLDRSLFDMIVSSTPH